MSHTQPVIRSRPCMVCQQITITPITEDQDKALAAGAPIQDVFPDMARDEREVLISGTHPQCWASMFGPQPE